MKSNRTIPLGVVLFYYPKKQFTFLGGIKMKKRLISLLVAMVLLISSAVPVTSAFAADYDKKCHPDDWFGYHHSKEEIESWITNAVG